MEAKEAKEAKETKETKETKEEMTEMEMMDLIKILPDNKTIINLLNKLYVIHFSQKVAPANSLSKILSNNRDKDKM